MSIQTVISDYKMTANCVKSMSYTSHSNFSVVFLSLYFFQQKMQLILRLCIILHACFTKV